MPSAIMTPRGWVVAAIGVLGAAVAVRYFGDAVPQVAFEQHLSRETALAAADSFARAHALPRGQARRAVRFGGDDSLQVFLELGAGGKDSLNAVARGRDAALFQWRVRDFTPGDVREVRVHFATDGRVTGFERRLADADRRPAPDSAAAHALADTVLQRWLQRDARRWRVVAHASLVVPASGRTDRTFTYERRDRRLGDAPIRLEVKLGGDLVTGAREFVKIPEAFVRRYAEMRAANDLTALLAQLGFPLYALVALVALAVYQRRGVVRWRPALIAAAVIGVLFGASSLNEMPLAWYGFDTAGTAGVFVAGQLVFAILGPVVLAAFLLVVIAAGEVLARHAFPQQLDWWQLWRQRGTRDVAQQVFSGYALCGFGLGYVALFYLGTRTLLGWWVPSELLDDPNLIATPAPWISAVANALQAGVMEEILFRVIPLSAVTLLTRGRTWQRAAVVATAVLTALVFGFAHANYTSWPPYSRGVELFAEALLWAAVFLRYGAVPTVVCHTIFDLLLFGLFAAAGDAMPYRITLAVVVAVAVLPAAAVLLARRRQGMWREAGPEARFAAWRPDDEPAAGAVPAAPGDAGVVPMPASVPARPAAAPPFDMRLLLAGLATGLIFFTPRGTPSVPRYTIDVAQAELIADSVMRARGADPAGWRRLTVHRMPDDPLAVAYFADQDADSLERTLARTYLPRALWVVRYVHPAGELAQRTESWRVRLLADGEPLDVSHRIAEDAPRPPASDDAVRRVARVAAGALLADSSRLALAEFHAEPRPHRRDALVEFDDRSVRLPGKAVARVKVSMAEGEPLSVLRDLVIPESFERAQRSREQALQLGAVVSFSLLVALLVGAAIWVVRHRPVQVEDDGPSRRVLWVCVAAYAGYLLLRAANGWPNALASWDTATPWRSHVASRALGSVVVVFGVIVIAAFWVAADRMRQRLGIPFLPVPGPAGVRETVSSGLALAALPLIVLHFEAVADGATTDAALVSTTMDALVPLASRTLEAFGTVASWPAVLALPVMVMLGVTTRPGWRLLPMLLVAALLTVPTLAFSERQDVPAPLLAASVVLVVVTVVPLLARWGRASVASWLVAALAYEVLSQARLAILAAHPVDHASATLGCIASFAALAWLVRWMRGRSRA